MNLGRTFLFHFCRTPFKIKAMRFAVRNASLLSSLFLHFFVVLICIVDFTFIAPKSEKVVSVPVMSVDLSNIPVTSITNLPPELGKAKEKKEKPKKKSVKTSVYSKAVSKPADKVRQKTNKKSDTALVVKQLDSLLDDVLKQPEKPQKRQAQKKSKTDDFQTLLASVDGLRKAPAEQDFPDYLEDEAQNKGIKGGQGGSFAQELSVSEKDMLGLKLKACWNIDAGVRGAQDMIVEIRAYLAQDGAIKDVKILNAKRYKKDAAFRSVAESARRAVYICAEKEDSPFLYFSKTYPDGYDTWKTLLLRFNPLDGAVL